MKFINRVWEINELDKYSKSGKLMVIYGRRRVGKTTLITHWLKSKKGVYSQAIEGSSLLQIGQVCEDLREILKSEIQPQNWVQFFELLEKSVNENTIICLDEFPYLVESDPSLPSILQKWMDHKKHSKINFILSGSSQKMMHSIFLNHSSPLFGRATRVLKVEPMTYIDFCAACGLNKKNMESFILYSMVGGLPKYWEALNVIKECESIDLANLLYFDRGALLENEPRRILSDEKVEGITPVSVLEAIGRGSHRPSEISSRIGVKQSSLSKVFSQLIDISLIERQIPFGSPEKDAKKTLYKITDPMLNFWYSVYSALRSQWQFKTTDEKKKALNLFASHVFEDEIRKHFKGSRYWDEKVEFDCVTQTEKKVINVIEVKFSKLNSKERKHLENQLNSKVVNSKLSLKWQVGTTQVFDWTDFCKLL